MSRFSSAVRLVSLFAVGAWLLTAGPGDANAQDSVTRADEVRSAVLRLDLDEASRLLEAGGRDGTALGLERGRFLLYATRYDEAVEVLERPDVARTEEGAQLGVLARNCARSVAGAFVIEDAFHGIVVRVQDDRDQVLVPILGEVVEGTRKAIRRDMGVELPRPLRIELVRDHFSLASMTGLPEEAARTTGTVAIANWGRVAMVSPRATTSGFPWLDTLAHELAHVALGMGTRDRAPLWLQEGVAKHIETRWRRPDAYDDYPSSDALAVAGFARGLARAFDDIGPSVAMLPTAEHAMVVFAEVESFIRYLVKEVGPDLLPELVSRLGADLDDGDVSALLETMTGRDLEVWTEEWRKSIEGADPALPPELTLAEGPPASMEAVRGVRLGKLLLARGHEAAAAKALSVPREQMPRELQVRYLLAKAYLRMGRTEEAIAQVREAEPPMVPYADAFAMHGSFLVRQQDREGAELAFFRAISLNPWNTEVACEALDAPSLPPDDDRAALCVAARTWPRY